MEVKICEKSSGFDGGFNIFCCCCWSWSNFARHCWIHLSVPWNHVKCKAGISHDSIYFCYFLIFTIYIFAFCLIFSWRSLIFKIFSIFWIICLLLVSASLTQKSSEAISWRHGNMSSLGWGFFTHSFYYKFSRYNLL